MDIAELLAFSVKNNASDLHLSSGLPPMIRVDGDIRRLTLPALETAQVQELIYSTMSDQHRRDFEANLEAICDLGQKAGVPVVLTTVGVNLRHCAPFASRDGAELDVAIRDAFERTRELGDEALGAGDLTTAQRHYRQVQ